MASVWLCLVVVFKPGIINQIVYHYDLWYSPIKFAIKYEYSNVTSTLGHILTTSLPRPYQIQERGEDGVKMK